MAAREAILGRLLERLELRLLKGRQVPLAKALGIDQKEISKWVRYVKGELTLSDLSLPGPDKLAAICAKEGINPTWLLLGQGSPTLVLETAELAQAIADAELAEQEAQELARRSPLGRAGPKPGRPKQA